MDLVFVVILQELLQGEDERGVGGEKSNDIRKERKAKKADPCSINLLIELMASNIKDSSINIFLYNLSLKFWNLVN